MNLKDWMTKNRYSQVQLSEMINYSPGFISQCVNGFAKPGNKFMKIISQVTNGEVSEDDWKEIILQKKA